MEYIEPTPALRSASFSNDSAPATTAEGQPSPLPNIPCDYYCSARDDINVRGQQYAQTTENSSDNQDFYGLALPPDTNIGIEAGSPLLASQRIQSETPFKTPTEIIDEFFEEFPRPFEPITQIEKNAMSWRCSQDPSGWLSWYKIKNRNSAYVFKAILRRSIVNAVHENVVLLKRRIARHPNDTAFFQHKEALIAKQITAARQFGIFDTRARSELGRWREWQENHTDANARTMSKHKNKRKRETPNRLPPSWSEELSKAMGYHPVIDLYICAGNRPSEVHQVTLAIADGQLTIKIYGSKLSGCAGQASRLLMPNMNLSAARRLAARASDFDFSGVNLNAIRARMARTSMRLWNTVVSPYCFRHDLAGRLKAVDGHTGDRVPKILGHQADRTSSRYGTRTGKSRGAEEGVDPIVYVSTSGHVRKTRSMRYRAGEAPAEPAGSKQRKSSKE